MGGGMAACAAALEPMRWAEGTNLKIKLIHEAALSRSGAMAQGLSGINTYVGENDPADYDRCVRNDLMGTIRADLVYDVGRHVDDSVHNYRSLGALRVP
jgi:adenylylsulfate reductase subunit A